MAKTQKNAQTADAIWQGCESRRQGFEAGGKPAIEIALEQALAAVRAEFYGSSGKSCRATPVGYGKVFAALRTVGDIWSMHGEQENEWSKYDN
jgi:hypothetical protein